MFTKEIVQAMNAEHLDPCGDTVAVQLANGKWIVIGPAGVDLYASDELMAAGAPVVSMGFDRDGD